MNQYLRRRTLRICIPVFPSTIILRISQHYGPWSSWLGNPGAVNHKREHFKICLHTFVRWPLSRATSFPCKLLTTLGGCVTRPSLLNHKTPFYMFWRIPRWFPTLLSPLLVKLFPEGFHAFSPAPNPHSLGGPQPWNLRCTLSQSPRLIFGVQNTLREVCFDSARFETKGYPLLDAVQAPFRQLCDVFLGRLPTLISPQNVKHTANRSSETFLNPFCPRGLELCLKRKAIQQALATGKKMAWVII